MENVDYKSSEVPSLVVAATVTNVFGDRHRGAVHLLDEHGRRHEIEMGPLDAPTFTGHVGKRNAMRVTVESIDSSSEARPGADGLTDADVAREFFRRFGPVKVLVGTWGKAVAYAESDGASSSSEWLSGMSDEHDMVEEHAAGEDGFAAALERARQLVRGGR